MRHAPAEGIFTDSANYAHLIPESSNISVGYENEHTSAETLDSIYLERLIERLALVDWTGITIARDPNAVDPGFPTWMWDEFTECPMCHGEDQYCSLCDGEFVVSMGQADEFYRQNPDAA